MNHTHSHSEYFQSSDIALIATLSCLGFSIENIDTTNPSKAIFQLKDTEELRQTVKSFFAHELQVEPVSFYNLLRELKARIRSW